MEQLWASCIIGYVVAYPALSVLLRLAAPQFAELPTEKRQYVVSNLLKGTVLATITWTMRHTVLDMVLSRPWNAESLRSLVPVYCGLDLVSLALVPKMMVSTRIHHVLVVGCGGYLSLLPTIQPNSIASCICVYATCSSTAYAVNGLLGLRHLVRDTDWRMRAAARVSAAIYAGGCAFNWMYQIHAIAQAPSQLWPMVPITLGFIYDDIILLRWLVRYE
jgi:hypothetical protein